MSDRDTKPVKLHLDRIRTDGGTQTRAGLNQDTVNDYAETIASLPPVVVFFDGTDYWLADGFHRVAAARQAGVAKLAADVHQGDRREAILWSVGANAAHGLRRSREDKRRAVETLLRDEEWSGWSDRVIAKRAGVHHQLVATLRAQLDDHPPAATPERRGADGKSYPATRAADAPADPVSLPPHAPSVDEPETESLFATPERGGEAPEYDGDEWYTPAKYVELAREVMGGIDLDPASCHHAQQTVKADLYITKEVDGLVGKWLGRVWCNPPYSEPEPFTSKLLEEYEAGRVTQAVLLVNNATDAGWFQELLQAGLPVCFVAGRMRFERPDRDSGPARQGQAFFYFGDLVGRFAQVFGTIGTVVAHWGYRDANGDAVLPEVES